MPRQPQWEQKMMLGARPLRVSAVGLALVAGLAGAAVGGCSAGEDDGAASAPSTSSATSTTAASEPADDGVPLLQPGEPGEPASTLPPGTTVEPGEVSHADIAFVQMMIPHHEQALEMSALAADRASSPAVRSLARRISGQGTEVMAMAAWLQQHDLEVPTAGADPMEFDHGEHGHHTMMGMLTDEQFDALRAARGPAFDRLYLTGMIGHHQGALDMIEDLADGGSDVYVADMAADMQATQTAEIDLMRSMLEP